MTANELAMIDATNAARAIGRRCGKYGYFPPAAPLTGNLLLAEAAQQHADDMTTNNFFSHTGSRGSRFDERLTRTGYRWSFVEENLAAGYARPKRAVAALLESAGHCRNIMNPRVTEIGVAFGSSRATRYKSYWVQEFGAPK